MKEYESDPVKYKQYIKEEKLYIPIGPNHSNSWKSTREMAKSKLLSWKECSEGPLKSTKIFWNSMEVVKNCLNMMEKLRLSSKN